MRGYNLQPQSSDRTYIFGFLWRILCKGLFLSVSPLLYHLVLDYIPARIIILAGELPLYHQILGFRFTFISLLQKECGHSRGIIWTAIARSSQPCCMIFAYKWLHQPHIHLQSDTCGRFEHQECGKHSRLVDCYVQSSRLLQDTLAKTLHSIVLLLAFHSA